MVTNQLPIKSDCIMEKTRNNIIKIAVISDLHVMAPELLVKEGDAFEAYLNRDRKMLREST